MASKPARAEISPTKPHPEGMAVVVRISEADFKDIERAGNLQFITGGRNPMFRFGDKSIDVALSAEKYTTEVFETQKDSNSSQFISRVAYRARLVHHLGEPQEQDEALLALSNELAAYKKEKEASQTHLANGFLPIPKNRREAAQQQKRSGFLAASKHLGPASPSLSTAQTLLNAPTSAPKDTNDRRSRAMRIALVHFLAKGDASTMEIAKATHIPDIEAKQLLRTMAQPVDRKWRLYDRYFRELDVWKFKYAKEEDRKAVIQNAIRAYDRARLSKDDSLWQLLLPKHERDRGTVLSRLHLSTSSQHASTPRVESPAIQPDAYLSSSANTPLPAPSTTITTTTNARKAGADVMKRLLSKDPKKMRAVDEANEKKKRKERQSQDDAGDARPTKVKVMTASRSVKGVKSEEFVNSSDEDEMKDESTGDTQPSTCRSPLHARSISSSAIHDRDPSSARKSTAAPRSPASGTTPLHAGRLTPRLRETKAPAAKSRSHMSPPKPTVPSPLGAARPRDTSDVSDRSGISNHRRSNTADEPRGLGITSAVVRQRHDTVTDMDLSEDMRSQLKQNNVVQKSKHASSAATITTGRNHGSDNAHDSRKSSADTTAKTQSSDDRLDGGTSDSSTSFVESISFSQGVDLAQKFKAQYYPQYAKLYDSVADRRRRGDHVTDEDFDKLYEMQERLGQMKREIEAASARKHSRSSS